MRARRRAAAIAAGGLLAVVIASQSWTEVPRRLRFLAAFAPKELALRRLGGSGAAFDRRFFSFLENARRRAPASAKGVVIFGAPEDESHLYLAGYQFAPRPVVFGFPGQDRAWASGWVVADYGGPQPPPAAPALARFPEGYLYGPLP